MTDNAAACSTSPAPRACKWFWDKMDKLTATRPMTEKEQRDFRASKARESFAKISKNIDTVSEFIEDVEKVVAELKKTGVDLRQAEDFLGRISRPFNRVKLVKDMTEDAIVSAEEVQLQLATWYHQAENGCRNKGDDSIDLAQTICSAELVRQWQGRNVKAVLGTQPDSWVMKLWQKWQDRIFSLL